jgi:hypothetical protein
MSHACRKRIVHVSIDKYPNFMLLIFFSQLQVNRVKVGGWEEEEQGGLGEEVEEVEAEEGEAEEEEEGEADEEGVQVVGEGEEERPRGI